MAINKLLVRDVVSLTDMTWPEKVVRALIQFRQHGRGWTEWPVKAMARELGMTRRTFTRAVATLEQSGWLEVERSRGRKSRYRAIRPPADRQMMFTDAPAPASKLKPTDAPDHPSGEPAERHGAPSGSDVAAVATALGTQDNMAPLTSAPEKPDPRQSGTGTQDKLAQGSGQFVMTLKRINACKPAPAKGLQQPISQKTTTKEEEKRTTTKEATPETGVVVQKTEAQKALLESYRQSAKASKKASSEQPPTAAQPPRVEQPPPHMVGIDVDDWREVRRLLRDWGAPELLVSKLTRQCVRPPTAVRVAQALEVADRYRESHGSVLKNPTGFILEALKEGWE